MATAQPCSEHVGPMWLSIERPHFLRKRGPSLGWEASLRGTLCEDQRRDSPLPTSGGGVTIPWATHPLGIPQRERPRQRKLLAQIETGTLILPAPHWLYEVEVVIGDDICEYGGPLS